MPTLLTATTMPPAGPFFTLDAGGAEVVAPGDTPPRPPRRMAVVASVATAVLAAALYAVLFPIAWQAALDEQITAWHVVLVALPVTELVAMVVVPLTLLGLRHPGDARRWFLGLLVCSATLSVLVVMFYGLALAVA